jgi:hypothetical protein
LSGSGLTASSFNKIDFTNGSTNNSLHPDFSSTGAEIFFGVEFIAFNNKGETANVFYDSLNITVAQTPLPAALPLFATGLGALGLLGWRRKRKNAAAIAARSKHLIGFRRDRREAVFLFW